MPVRPREAVVDLNVAEHGGVNYAELEKLGVSPDEVIDFSVNTSPNGFPRRIRPLVKSVRLAHYPDSQSLAFKRVIAHKIGISTDNILAGNGSTELIRLAVSAYIDARDRALIIEPTYGEYRTACAIAGAQVITQVLSEETSFKPDVDSTIKSMKRNKPKAVFICNPNNPTGHYLSRCQFQEILAAAVDSLVILDEAYISFVENGWSSLDLIGCGNLLIIRSMTKDYGLAGLRLGYAVACQEIIRVLRRVCPPWNVNVVAQQAGMVALSQERHLREGRRLALAGKQYLTEELTRLGFHCLPSAANFFLVEVENAPEFRKRLLNKGIIVRDCTSFGLPNYIRVAPQRMKRNLKLISALKEIRAEG